MCIRAQSLPAESPVSCAAARRSQRGAQQPSEEPAAAQAATRHSLWGELPHSFALGGDADGSAAADGTALEMQARRARRRQRTYMPLSMQPASAAAAPKPTEVPSADGADSDDELKLLGSRCVFAPFSLNALQQSRPCSKTLLISGITSHPEHTCTGPLTHEHTCIMHETGFLDSTVGSLSFFADVHCFHVAQGAVRGSGCRSTAAAAAAWRAPAAVYAAAGDAAGVSAARLQPSRCVSCLSRSLCCNAPLV